MKYRHIEYPKETSDDGSLIIYNNIKDGTFVLNSTSAQIYELCKSKSPEQIAQELVKGLETCPEMKEVLNDVETSLQDFVDKGLIIEVEG